MKMEKIMYCRAPCVLLSIRHSFQPKTRCRQIKGKKSTQLKEIEMSKIEEKNCFNCSNVFHIGICALHTHKPYKHIADLLM